MLQAIQTPVFGLASSRGRLAPGLHQTRRVYFSFQYPGDLARVDAVRKLPNVVAYSAAGFEHPGLWNKTCRMGQAAVKQMIDSALANTTVTVVCIGQQSSANDRYVAYEIERSFQHGNGIVGRHVHHLPDRHGRTAARGRASARIAMSGYRVHDYAGPERLAAAIEEARRLAQP